MLNEHPPSKSAVRSTKRRGGPGKKAKATSPPAEPSNKEDCAPTKSSGKKSNKATGTPSEHPPKQDDSAKPNDAGKKPAQSIKLNEPQPVEAGKAEPKYVPPRARKAPVVTSSNPDMSCYDQIQTQFTGNMNQLQDALCSPETSLQIPTTHFNQHKSIDQIRDVGIHLCKVLKQFPLLYKRNGYNPVSTSVIKPKLDTLGQLVDQLVLNVLIRPVELGWTIREFHVCAVMDIITSLSTAVADFTNSLADHQHPLYRPAKKVPAKCDSLFNSNMSPKLHLVIQELPTNNAEAVFLKWKAHLAIHESVALELGQIKLDIMDLDSLDEPVLNAHHDPDFDIEFDEFETPNKKIMLNNIPRPVVDKQSKILSLVDKVLTYIHSLTKQFVDLIQRIGFYDDIKINHSCYMDQYSQYAFDLNECIGSVHLSLMNFPLPKPDHDEYLDFYSNFVLVIRIWFSILTPPDQHVDSWLIQQLIDLEQVHADQKLANELVYDEDDDMDGRSFEPHSPSIDVAVWVHESRGKLKQLQNKVFKTLPKPKH